MKIDSVKKAILEEWEKCLFEFYSFGDNTRLNKFAKIHTEDFNILRRMNLKRLSIKDTIEPILLLELPLYWITLTFNDKKDNNTELYKLKEAESFLNELSPLWLIVEEYGEVNKRYHVHGFICRKMNITEEEFFKRFSKWHSRRNLYKINTLKSGLKRVKYISKYIVKQVPHLRRSKNMSRLYAFYKSIKKLRRSFPSLLEDRLNYYFDDNLLENFYFK